MGKIIVVNKPTNMTSRDVVDKVGKILKTKKIGHTGTLDPMATGVLVLCEGNATKVVQFLTNDEKIYECEITLGYLSDTEDLMSGDEHISKEEVVREINNSEVDEVLLKLIGKQRQRVPMYSAVKVNGKKLYEYARKGIVIEDRPIKDIEIKSLKRTSEIYYNNGKPKFKFICEVSKGTFIRTLCVNIANKLGSIGAMSDLKRVKSGNFTIEEAIDIENINSKTKFFSIREALSFDEIEVDDYIANKIHHGSKLDDRYESETVTFINNNRALAVYSKHTDNKMKAKRVF